jgi:hypothetical protein
MQAHTFSHNQYTDAKQAACALMQDRVPAAHLLTRLGAALMQVRHTGEVVGMHPGVSSGRPLQHGRVRHIRYLGGHHIVCVSSTQHVPCAGNGTPGPTPTLTPFPADIPHAP